jgi:hypothetical protein
MRCDRSNQSIDTNGNQKNGAHKCIAPKKRAIDSSQIEFLGFVFVEKRRGDEGHSTIIEQPELRGDTKRDERSQHCEVQYLRQPKTARDPKFHDKRPNTFASIKIVILRRINQVKACDPANHASSEDERRKIDMSRLRNPCTDWGDC